VEVLVVVENYLYCQFYLLLRTMMSYFLIYFFICWRENCYVYRLWWKKIV